ncbi:MAG TPA: GAF domain-containing protein [Methylomirabilota bacterium]|nr:GAF domain-containing protein [Methylomirabilota bacterium]
MRRSRSALQGILTEVARTAAKLCEARDCLIFLVEGDQVRLAAQHGTLRHTGVMPPLSRRSLLGRAILDRRTLHVRDLTAARRQFPASPAVQHASGLRTVVATPLLVDGAAVGGIIVRRTVVRPFTPRQISLLKTFASQAAVAIENARLSEELEARNRELTAALERETATSEILRVISSSPTGLEPVLVAVAQNAARVCGASDSLIRLLEGDILRLVAHHGPLPELDEVIPLDRGTASGRAISDRQTIHIHDLAAQTETEFPIGKSFQRRFGHRTVLATPLLRESVAIGSILIRRQTVDPFSDKQIELLKTFADQAVIAIENVRLFTELQARNRDLTEALERETATSEILKVISSSPTDIQPVLDAVAESATRLCTAYDAVIFRLDDGVLHRAAHFGPIPAPPGFSIVPTRGRVSGRAVVDRRPIQVTDALAESEEFPETRTYAREHGFRTILSVPLLREGVAIGTIDLRRTEVQPFTEAQIALLQTFADQAVIAIENVRLFNEIREALEQQTATAEILRVISQSPTTAQPVFDTIVRNAGRVCDSFDAVLILRDGNDIEIVAHWGPIDHAGIGSRRPLSRGTVMGRAIIDGRPIHVEDLSAAADFPEGQALAQQRGHRTTLAVPLLREGGPVGSLLIRRRDVRPFNDKHIRMLQTFADQAVIAIENVRLFTELQARNRDLTEALDRETATSAVLRIISRSPTDVGPVFDGILKSAVGLCDALYGVAYRYDGAMVHVMAHHNFTPEALGALNAVYPAAPGSDTATDEAIRRRTVIHVPDSSEDPSHSAGQAIARRLGYRTLISVPMLREGEAIGAITVARRERRMFSDTQIALLQTFADQAVIAIENVRLFTELQARNRDLTVALAQQTATSEVLAVISGAQTDVQPVFDAIARSARHLCDATYSSVYRLEGELVHLVAHNHQTPEAADMIRASWPIPLTGDSLVVRAIRECVVVHHDAQQDPEVSVAVRTRSRALDQRRFLAVPMVREGQPIGAIRVSRSDATPFTEQHIALLKTFADQAVIAIENVRLFTELQARNRDLSEALEQQTATAEILRAISSSPTDLQPVMDAIAENAGRVCAATDAVIYRVEGHRLRIAAARGSIPRPPVDGAESLRPIARDWVTGRAVVDRATVHVPDLANVSEMEFPLGREIARRLGHRTTLATPLLREGVPVGAILIRRTEVRPFSDKQIRLLETFADQAVIAIENVRLFTELQARNQDLSEALDRQTATSEILKVISQSHTDTQPVFDTIIRSAVRLCAGTHGSMVRVDGDTLRLWAHYNLSPEERELVTTRYPAPVSETSLVALAVRTRTLVHSHDTLNDPRSRSLTPYSQALGLRAQVTVPLLKNGEAIGTLNVLRNRPGAFSEAQIELLQTFADQAVIAVENVRLFTELQARNRDLSQALSQQTAISEVLQVISRSVFDLRTVLQTLVENATSLCGAEKGFIFRRVGDVYRLAVDHGAAPDYRAFIEASPITPSRATLVGRTVLEGRAVHIPDAVADPEYGWSESQRRGGFRTMLGVPMLREGVPIGVIAMWKTTVVPFTDAQIDLVTTFANQAVIAIENARLLSELQTRTQELTRSVGQLTALGEVGQAVSSTLDLETVLQTICVRAAQLAGAEACTVSEYDEVAEVFHQRATHNLDDEVVAVARRTPVRKGEGVQGRMAITRQPVQISDIGAADAYHGPFRDVLLRTGTRAVLAIPLLREDHLVGSLTVNKKTPGEFPPETVELLKTFATQSAIAIQNARLFREIEDKSRQLEVASRHKSQFLANMSHELRTPLNAILGYTELIADKIYGEVPERMGEVLERVDKSGRHLLGLINDILDLSKIEAGQLTLALTDYSMADVVQSVAVSVEALAREKQLDLAVTVDPDLPLGRGDQRRLTQVVLNLVGNALKFTDTGRVAVRARRADDAFLVEVADTGPGIAPADQAKIFEEFQQADSATTRAKGGTGLGLAIARRIIEMHGGHMWVESTLGQGSTFSFTVPITAS